MSGRNLPGEILEIVMLQTLQNIDGFFDRVRRSFYTPYGSIQELNKHIGTKVNIDLKYLLNLLNWSEDHLEAVLELSAQQGNFRELCSQLLIREYPNTDSVSGKREDLDLEIHRSTKHNLPEVVWQARFFLSPLRAQQKHRIKDCFEKFANIDTVTKWILFLPRDLNATEQEWFQELNKPKSELIRTHRRTLLYLWGETKLRELLLKYPDIFLKFFPLTGEQQDLPGADVPEFGVKHA